MYRTSQQFTWKKNQKQAVCLNAQVHTPVQRVCSHRVFELRTDENSWVSHAHYCSLGILSCHSHCARQVLRLIRLQAHLTMNQREWISRENLEERIHPRAQGDPTASTGEFHTSYTHGRIFFFNAKFQAVITEF